MSESRILISRRRFLERAVMATGGTILAACASQTTPAPTAAPTKVAQATEAPEPTAAPTAAPTLPEVTLSYYFVIFAPMTDGGLVADAMSKITMERINAKVKLVPMDWGAFNEKLKLSLAAGEAIDLMFTASWANDFYANVRNGSLIALDDLLPKYAPHYWASIKPSVWDAARVKGKLYGAINQQSWANSLGFGIRKDVVEELKWDVTTLKSFDNWDPLFKAIKAQFPDMYPTNWGNLDGPSTWSPGVWGFDDIGIANTYVGIKKDDKDLKVLLFPETDEFKQAIGIARRWYQAGYLPSEPTSPEDANAQMKAGKFACTPLGGVLPGVESQLKTKFGFDFVAVPVEAYSGPFISTGSVVPTMTGIARTCKEPERAAMLLEMLNTDVEFYNLLCKGIEGKHWVWVDKAKKVIGFPPGVTAENSPYNPNSDWEFGNQFNAYYVDMAQADENVWEKSRKLNETADVSAAMGFAFVQDAVSAEMGQIATAHSELGIPVHQGRVDPAENTKFIEKLKAAGVDKVMAELQKQLGEWKATR